MLDSEPQTTKIKATPKLFTKNCPITKLFVMLQKLDIKSVDEYLFLAWDIETDTEYPVAVDPKYRKLPYGRDIQLSSK
jgi:hypothetical protein